MKRYMYTPAHFRALYAGPTVNAFRHDLAALFPFEEMEPLLNHLFSDKIFTPARDEPFKIIP
jgi:hypothetical protein